MSSPDQILSTCTVRIAGMTGSAIKSIGTGFLYAFPVPVSEGHSSARHVPTLITNKHVLAGCETIKIFFSLAPAQAVVGENGLKVGRIFQKFQLPIAAIRCDHPSPDVDLCGLNISNVVNAVSSAGNELQHQFLGQWIQLSTEARAYTRAVESVVMVGYPSGLWDGVNNSPLIRRGISATHPLVNYEGKKEFVIDAACFPGSSGSPVFLFEDGMYRSNATSYSPGSRIALLGVLYAGPQFTAEGRLEARPIPHNFAPTPITSVPMNLGFVIHADEVDVLGRTFLATVG